VKLNDPFGRVSRREQERYRVLEQRLRDEGILEVGALHRFTHRLTATILKLAGAVLVASAALALVFPKSCSLILMLDVLLLLWLSANYFKTRVYLKRYRRENFEEH
jgi:hypothetical protein